MEPKWLMQPDVAERYVTADVPGVGGVLKARPEDFFVEEIPAYEPSGEGEHLYMWVEKRNLSTMHLVRLIAEHYQVRRDAVGVAGLKDKNAVTHQMVSVHLPGKKETEFGAFEQPGAKVLWMDRHGNKLRRGHLKGNRFVIRIREVEPGKVIAANKVLRRLAREGVPNRIGAQRFGYLANNQLIGKSLVKGDDEGVLKKLLGVSERFADVQHEAREAFERGEYGAALELMPRSAHTERRVLGVLARGGKAREAVRAIEPVERSFYVTALQSVMFNRVFEQRLAAGMYAKLVEGDLAFKHENGAVFAVDAEMARDQEILRRLERIEISASGPMWSARSMRAGGKVDEMEMEALAEAGVGLGDFERYEKAGRGEISGERRPMRVPMMYPDIEGGVDEHGPYIKCRFELPKGSFATTVMAEIMKTVAIKEESEEE